MEFTIQWINLQVESKIKFKTITVKINFKRELNKEEITLRNMLINVLCESTSKYPTKRLMNIATEELYELNYRAGNYISGKYNIMGFDVTFLNEESNVPPTFCVGESGVIN